ncbi:hypothetical protein [Nocardioides sp. NPDC004968]|uniref:hypothetical protein n=1 Tax=Nocardioides sp. NPDC004968 TaxID=3155894 RepID=UPI0033AF8554
MSTHKDETATGGAVAKMSMPTLTAMVVGSMVGAGVFSLPRASVSRRASWAH